MPGGDDGAPAGKKTKRQRHNEANDGWKPTSRKATPVDADGTTHWKVFNMDDDVGSYLWREAYRLYKCTMALAPQVPAYTQEDWWGAAVGAEAQALARKGAEESLKAASEVAEGAGAFSQSDEDWGGAPTPEAIAALANKKGGLTIRKAKSLASAAKKRPQELASLTRRLFRLRVFRLPRLLNATVGFAQSAESITDGMRDAGNALGLELFGSAAEPITKEEVRPSIPAPRAHALVCTSPRRARLRRPLPSALASTRSTRTRRSPTSRAAAPVCR